MLISSVELSKDEIKEAVSRALAEEPDPVVDMTPEMLEYAREIADEVFGHGREA